MAEPLEAKLDQILDRLNNIEQRLEAIQPGWKPYVPPGIKQAPAQARAKPPEPPPYIPKPEPEVRVMPVGAAVEPKPATPNAEYVIGAKLIPRVGAACVIAGFLFLIAWGYTQGWITPRMILGLEILFSSVLAGLGLRLGAARENFGEVLTGVGLAGLYASFVGGYQAYHLYSGSVMLGLSLAVSLVMLGICWRKAWMGVGALGAAGGLIASTFPLQQADFQAGIALHFLVLIAGLGVAIKTRRVTFVALMWLGSMAVLIGLYSRLYGPAFDARAADWAIAAAGVLSALGFDLARASRENLPGFAIGVVGLHSAFSIRHDRPEIVLATGAAGAVMLAAASRTHWRVITAYCAGFLMLFAPLCFEWRTVALAYCYEAVGLALVSSMVMRKGLSSLSLGLAIVAGAVYAANLPLTPHDSNLTLLALLAHVAGLAGVMGAFDEDGQAGGVLLSFPGIAGFGSLLAYELSNRNNSSVTIAWTVLGALYVSSGAIFKRSALRWCGFFLFGCTVFKIAFVDLAMLEIGYKVLILMVLGLILLGIGYAYVRQPHRKSHPPAV